MGAKIIYLFMFLLIMQTLYSQYDNQINYIDSSAWVKDFTIDNAKLVFGNDGINCNDFIVFANYILINDVGAGKLKLIKRDNNLLCDEFDYINSIKGLKFYKKEYSYLNMRETEDGFTKYDIEYINTPFYGDNYQSYRINDSLFYINLIKIKKEYKLFTIYISNGKIKPYLIDYLSPDYFKLKFESDTVNFSERAYIHNLTSYNLNNDNEYFTYSSRILYKKGFSESITIGDTVIGKDTLKITISKREIFLKKNGVILNNYLQFMGAIPALYTLAEDKYLVLHENDISIFENDSLLFNYSLDSLILNLKINRNRAFKIIFKDYSSKQFFLGIIDVGNNVFRIFNLGESITRTNKIDLKMVKSIYYQNYFLFNSIDDNKLYFSTLAPYSLKNYIYSVDLNNGRDSLFVGTIKANIKSDPNLFNHHYSKKTSKEFLDVLTKDDFTLIKPKELRLLKEYYIPENLEEYPHSNIMELLKSIIKSIQNDNIYYPTIYLSVFKNTDYSKFKKQLKEILNENKDSRNKNSNYDLILIFEDMINNYDKIIFDSLNGVIYAQYKNYQFIFLELNGLYYIQPNFTVKPCGI